MAQGHVAIGSIPFSSRSMDRPHRVAQWYTLAGRMPSPFSLVVDFLCSILLQNYLGVMACISWEAQMLFALSHRFCYKRILLHFIFHLSSPFPMSICPCSCSNSLCIATSTTCVLGTSTGMMSNYQFRSNSQSRYHYTFMVHYILRQTFVGKGWKRMKNMHLLDVNGDLVDHERMICRVDQY